MITDSELPSSAGPRSENWSPVRAASDAESAPCKKAQTHEQRNSTGAVPYPMIETRRQCVWSSEIGKHPWASTGYI